jgi:hypothetical protein
MGCILQNFQSERTLLSRANVNRFISSRYPIVRHLKALHSCIMPDAGLPAQVFQKIGPHVKCLQIFVLE